jgi:hypothetical protein
MCSSPPPLKAGRGVNNCKIQLVNKSNNTLTHFRIANAVRCVHDKASIRLTVDSGSRGNRRNTDIDLWAADRGVDVPKSRLTNDEIKQSVAQRYDKANRLGDLNETVGRYITEAWMGTPR